jgi:hypothetical protein
MEEGSSIMGNEKDLFIKEIENLLSDLKKYKQEAMDRRDQEVMINSNSVFVWFHKGRLVELSIMCNRLRHLLDNR